MLASLGRACVWLGLALLLMGSSCGKKPPAPPAPLPQCDEAVACDCYEGEAWRACEPTTAPPGVHFVELLLRRDGSRFVTLEGEPVDFRQCISCCGGLAGSLWPVDIGEPWTAPAIEAGCNAFHARLGPFLSSAEGEWQELGGPYLEVDGKADLTQWNQEWWDLVALRVYELGLQGVRVQVGLDFWRARHGLGGDPVGHPWAAGNNVQGEDHLSGLLTSAELDPVVEAFVRKTVLELGRFGSVLWFDGTEAFLMPGYAPEATWALRALFLEAENALEYPVHMFGTEGGHEAAAGQVDYVVLHGSAAREPIHNKPTLVNEYNGTPPLRPDQWMLEQCIAEAAGTYRAYWRGWRPQPEADVWRTLELWREGDCSFAEEGCQAPPADAPGWVPAATRPTRLGQVVAAARARMAKPCSRDPFVTLARLAYELRLLGECASGPWADAVVIRGRDGQWEEWHAVAFGRGCWTGEGFKGVYRYEGAIAAACGSPRPPELRDFGLVRLGSRVDGTPRVFDCAFCDAIGLGVLPGGEGPRCKCPVRPDGHAEREACEELVVGVPSWSCDGCELVATANPYTVRLRGDGGTVRLCDERGLACSELVW